MIQGKPQAKNTSWQKVHNWYDDIVGDRGHYYHKAIVLPRTLALLGLPVGLHDGASLLDIACGQGVLARSLPSHIEYVGIDASKNLIKSAMAGKLPHQEFYVADATKPLPIGKKVFTHAAIILALQNIQDPKAVLHNAKLHLKPGGKVVIVLNHPCFRIPRQSHWGVDERSKTQYRRMDTYMTSQSIPIDMHPGKKREDEAHTTWSFHHPLSSYSQWLFEEGFRIEKMEEWCSDKVSTGPKARMENRARKEFPLFLAISAIAT